MGEELENKTKTYIRGLLTSSPLVLTINKLLYDYKNTIGSEIPFRQMGYSSLELFLKSIPDTVRVEGNGYYAKLYPVITPKTAHINEMVVRQKTKIKRPEKFPVSERGPQTGMQGPPRQTTGKPNNNLIKTVDSYVEVPNGLQRELQEVISKHPDGIWCADLPHYYKKSFNKTLNYKAHGYRSLTDMCVDLKKVFRCIRPDCDDILLFDASKPLPKNVEHISKSRVEDDKLTQLKLNIPDEACDIGTVIPRYFRDDLKKDDLVDVVVTEICDPSKFWVYFSDGPLDSLMDNMQVWYKKHSTDYLVPESLLVEGFYCTSIIFNEYHRGLIVDSMPEVKGYVKVLFIDYGTLTKVKTDGICYLHKQFAKIPCQNIRCRMPYIVPLDKIAPWSISTISRFKELIRGRKIQAKIGAVKYEEELLEVYLADVTDGKNKSYLHDKLVDEGLAQYEDSGTNKTDGQRRLALLKKLCKQQQ